jgi:signal transduction histidine kinase
MIQITTLKSLLRCWIFITSLWVAFSPYMLHSQSGDVLVLDRHTTWQGLPEGSKLLADSTFSLCFDSIHANPVAYPFRPVGSSVVNFPDGAVYWLTFKVHNPDTVSSFRYLMMYHKGVEYAQLFTIDEQGDVTTYRQQGAATPAPYLAMQVNPIGYWLVFPPKSTLTCYLYVDQRFLPLSTPIAFDANEVVFPTIINARVKGVWIGVGLIYWIIGLAMFSLMRERLHAAYLLYLTGGVGYFMSTSYFGYVSIWSNYGGFEAVSDTVFALICVSGFVLVAKYFFMTRQYLPRTDRVLVAVAVLNLLVIVGAIGRHFLPLGSVKYLVAAAICGSVLSMLLVVWVAIWHYIRFKTKDALWFLGGFSVFFASSTLNILMELGVVRMYELVHHYLPTLNLFFEFTLLSWLLMRRLYRAWMAQKWREFELQQSLRTQREQLSRDLHDDVGATLQSISVFSEMAKRAIQRADTDAVPTLNRIGETSRQLMDTIQELVWTTHPAHDSMPQMIERMRLFAADLFMPIEVAFHFHADEAIYRLQLDAATRKNWHLIFKEALHNIYKHAQCTAVDVRITYTEDHVHLRIRDNGKGFDTAQQQVGNGLCTMQERARLLAGTCAVQTSPDHGTDVCLIFPVPEQTAVASPPTEHRQTIFGIF